MAAYMQTHQRDDLPDVTQSDQHVNTGTMSLALDGMLSAQAMAEFQQHLKVCSTCRTEWELWQSVADLLVEAPLVAPAPGFVARFESRVEVRQRRRWELLGGLVLITSSVTIWSLLAAGFTLVLGYWFFGHPLAISRVAALFVQIVGVGMLLLKATRLLLSGLNSPSTGLWLLIYGGCTLLLTTLWLRVLQRRPLLGRHRTPVARS
ncbi:MAG TPA: zf-HC2 domain-containing protein [Anaerolineae bacterium]|nr:zf-HC2 domain-containing protein [Anaerolineae bacterium]